MDITPENYRSEESFQEIDRLYKEALTSVTALANHVVQTISAKAEAECKSEDGTPDLPQAIQVLHAGAEYLVKLLHGLTREAAEKLLHEALDNFEAPAEPDLSEAIAEAERILYEAGE